MSDYNLTVKKRGLKLIIFEDCVEDPREYYKDDNIGKMVCFHHRLELGDEHNFKDLKSFEEWLKQNEKDILAKRPLYLIDDETCNGNVSITTYDDCRGVNELLGYIYCTKETLKHHWCYREDDYKEDIEERLEFEVSEYDDWLQNIPPYYSFEIQNKDKEVVEAMGVFECYEAKDMIAIMKERSDHEYDFLFDAALKKYYENCL